MNGDCLPQKQWDSCAKTLCEGDHPHSGSHCRPSTLDDRHYMKEVQRPWTECLVAH